MITRDHEVTYTHYLYSIMYIHVTLLLLTLHIDESSCLYIYCMGVNLELWSVMGASCYVSVIFGLWSDAVEWYTCDSDLDCMYICNLMLTLNIQVTHI